MTDERTWPATRVVLDPDAVRTWVRRAVESLAEHRDALDATNVFPVPDSDTGTNLWLTLQGALAAVDRLGPEADLGRTTRALTRGAVLGARGNSGVILGQYLAGLVQAVATGDRRWAEVLGAAAAAAYRAVGHPVEGTVLTVARAVATGARGDAAGQDALEELERGVRAGYVALERTTDELPVLRAAGVRDAGAWGLLLVLGALVEAVGGDARTTAALCGDRRACAGGRAADEHGGASDRHGGTPDGHGEADGTHDDGGGEFEVMFVADDEGGDAEVGDRLRALLGRVGGSVAVVGAAGVWQAHVHTDDLPGALAVPAASGLATRPALVRHLLAQAGVHGRQRPGVGLVAVTSAADLVPELARAGAVVVLVAAGQRLAGELARAVEDTGADDVLVLTSVPLAEEADPPVPAEVPAEVPAQVHDGLTDVHLVAAAAALVTARDDVDARDAVVAALERVRHVVVRDVGGPGDAGRVHDAARTLLADRPGTEVLTVVVGTDVPHEVVPGDVEGLEGAVTRQHPQVEVVVLRGAPGRDVLVGVE